jgi:hypothetical protein
MIQTQDEYMLFLTAIGRLCVGHGATTTQAAHAMASVIAQQISKNIFASDQQKRSALIEVNFTFSDRISKALFSFWSDKEGEHGISE